MIIKCAEVPGCLCVSVCVYASSAQAALLDDHASDAPPTTVTGKSLRVRVGSGVKYPLPSPIANQFSQLNTLVEFCGTFEETHRTVLEHIKY